MPYAIGASIHVRVMTMVIKVNIPEGLAAEARARGLSVEEYAEEIAAVL